MNTVRLWIKAVRPYAYSASLVPVAIGGLHGQPTEGKTKVGFRHQIVERLPKRNVTQQAIRTPLPQEDMARVFSRRKQQPLQIAKVDQA